VRELELAISLGDMKSVFPLYLAREFCAAHCLFTFVWVHCADWLAERVQPLGGNRTPQYPLHIRSGRARPTGQKSSLQYLFSFAQFKSEALSATRVSGELVGKFGRLGDPVRGIHGAANTPSTDAPQQFVPGPTVGCRAAELLVRSRGGAQAGDCREADRWETVPVLGTPGCTCNLAELEGTACAVSPAPEAGELRVEPPTGDSGGRSAGGRQVTRGRSA